MPINVQRPGCGSKFPAEDKLVYSRGKCPKCGEEIVLETEIIDLSDDINQGRIQVFAVVVSEVQAFRAKFDPVYLGDIDPGEAESLTYLVSAKVENLISSGDAIVFRILENLNREDQGISLEELLQRIGMNKPGILWPYTKEFRQNYTNQG
jgi:hypothetical protein